MSGTWQTLFVETMRTPDSAARSVLKTKIARSELWMGLVAASALNAVITGLTITIVPLPGNWPTLFNSPIAYFIMVVGGLVLLAHILTWAGRAIGGKGSLDDMLKLMVWMQFVRVVLQAVGLCLMLMIPLVAAIFSLITGLWSVWILMNFVKVGHKLATLMTALMVIFVTFLGMVIGLSVLLTLIGVGTIGAAV